MDKYYIESRNKETSYLEQNEERLTEFLNLTQELTSKSISEGNVERKRRQGRRRDQLLDDFKEREKVEFEREIIKSPFWKTYFRRDYVPLSERLRNIYRQIQPEQVIKQEAKYVQMHFKKGKIMITFGDWQIMKYHYRTGQCIFHFCWVDCIFNFNKLCDLTT